MLVLPIEPESGKTFDRGHRRRVLSDVAEGAIDSDA